MARDQEWVLVGSVRRPAVLDHPETAGGDLLVHPVAENDHAVRYVLLDPVPGERVRVVALLAGHDGGDGAFLEPPEEPAELRSHDGLVRERAEQQLNGVEHDALGPDALDAVVEQGEQRLKVELPRLDDFRGIHLEGMHREQPVPLQPVEIESQRGDVGAHLTGRLLEGDQHARLAVLPGARDEELQPQQRLAGSGAARHERRPAPRQPARGDLVQSMDPRRGLRQCQAPISLGQGRGQIGSAMIGRHTAPEGRFIASAFPAAGG